MSETLNKPVVLKSNRLPKDHKKFVSAKELAQLLRKLAAKISKGRPRSRWHMHMKLRAFYVAKARGIR